MIQKYKDWLTVNGKSASTIKNYISRIKTFLKKVKVEEITEANISKFLLDIREQYSPATINHYRDAIKSLLVFLKKDIPIPCHLKLDKKLPENFSEEYFKEKIIPMVEMAFENALRVKAIFYLMFYTGIRVSEIPSLKRENIDLTTRTAKIYVKKTKEERLIIFTEKVKEILTTYFSIEPENTNAFNTSINAITKICGKLKPYFKDINLHPHLFRHSFATHLRKQGIRIEDIKELMGHRSIQSTMRYAHTDIETIKKIYDEKINRSK